MASYILYFTYLAFKHLLSEYEGHAIFGANSHEYNLVDSFLRAAVAALTLATQVPILPTEKSTA